MDPQQLTIEILSPVSIAADTAIIFLSFFSPIYFYTFAKPFRDGFFCDDDTIRYPYKTSTVSVTNLYIFSTVIPILAITSVEALAAFCNKQLRHRRVLISGYTVPASIVTILRHMLLFGYGLSCLDVVVHTGKFTVGRLRPHFMDICRPDAFCNDTDPHAFIVDYNCTDESSAANIQSRLSFPSGHSSLSFFSAIFTVLYLEKRVWWPKQLIVFKTAVQMVVLALATFTALSRIHDHKHHWGDVATGSCLGIVFASFWIYRVLRLQSDVFVPSGDALVA